MSKKILKAKKTLSDCAYPSASVFLDIALKEYAHEEERAKNIDNRAGVLISALIVLLTFYLPNISLKKVLALPCISILPSIVLICYSMALISTVICLVSLMRTISVKKYDRFEGSSLSKTEYYQYKSSIAESALAQKVVLMTDSNIESNNQKVKFYSWGIGSLVAVVFFVSVSLIVSTLIL